jgi:hypothetical protein
MTEEPTTERRTKRRYAYELYPHAKDDEVRPLAIEVPTLYADAMGHEVWGTGWFAAIKTDEHRQEAADRTITLIRARQTAFLADALAQGLAGDEAWTWAEEQLADESGELAWERAEHYGVRPQDIKPYPCGPEPDHHDHFSNQTDRSGIVTRVDGPESTCPDCTEEVSE